MYATWHFELGSDSFVHQDPTLQVAFGRCWFLCSEVPMSNIYENITALN